MRTKIIASVGPSSCNVRTLKKMAENGVSCFRINFSHGDRSSWKDYAERIRKVEERIKKPIAIMGDLKGPSVRLGEIEGSIEAKEGEEIEFELKERSEGCEKVAPLPIPEAFSVISVGDIIVMDDGKVILKVTEKGKNFFKVKALTHAIITSHKSVVIKGKEVPLPALSEEDLKNLEFALEEGFDIIDLSYVKDEGEVKEVKRRIEEKGLEEEVLVSSKIEVPSGVKNLRAIARSSDFIVIARGDLGMHFSLEEIPKLQTEIANTCLRMGRPFIVATQLLGSMLENSVPTRSEIVDLVTALKEGADALMFTGETAVGKFPVEVVKWARKVIEMYSPKIDPPRIIEKLSLRDRFVKGVIELSEDLGAKLVVFTRSGITAFRVSKIRPRDCYYAASNDQKVLRKLSLLWGAIPIRIPAERYSEGLEMAFEKLCVTGELKSGDLVILTYGMREEKTHGILIKVVKRWRSTCWRTTMPDTIQSSGLSMALPI